MKIEHAVDHGAVEAKFSERHIGVEEGACIESDTAKRSRKLHRPRRISLKRTTGKTRETASIAIDGGATFGFVRSRRLAQKPAVDELHAVTVRKIQDFALADELKFFRAEIAGGLGEFNDSA